MPNNKNLFRSLAVVLWFMTWPLSELAGRPAGVDEDVPWPRALKLLGVAMVGAAIITAIFVTVDGCGR